MELFPASDSSAWKIIQKVIEESDYYVVVLSGRYGSVGADGVSFTEMEYDYAVSLSKPVLGFVRSNIDDIPAKYAESDREKKAALERFRKKVMSRSCVKFDTPEGLGLAVMKSLVSEVRINPQVGWIRADQAKSPEDREREDALRSALDEADRNVKRLERSLRDKSVLPKDIAKEALAQGEDKVSFRVRFRNDDKDMVAREVEISWDNILRVIGPSIYGYVVRRAKDYGTGRPRYPFENDLEDYILFQIIDEVGDRKIYLGGDQIDTCIFQFKEIGLLEFSEHEQDNGEIFRGVTLTPHGEQKVAVLKASYRG